MEQWEEISAWEDVEIPEIASATDGEVCRSTGKKAHEKIWILTLL